MTTFQITRAMFAIKRDGDPVLIIYPNKGTHALRSPDALAAWAVIHSVQSDEVRSSATGASMFGWDKPIAAAAVKWMQGPSMDVAAPEGES